MRLESLLTGVSDTRRQYQEDEPAAMFKESV
jgi:hypothetical protein